MTVNVFTTTIYIYIYIYYCIFTTNIKSDFKSLHYSNMRLQIPTYETSNPYIRDFKSLHMRLQIPTYETSNPYPTNQQYETSNPYPDGQYIH